MKNIYLIISLNLLIGTTIYGMDKHKNQKSSKSIRRLLWNNECLAHIVQQTCTMKHTFPTIIKTMKSFSLVNKRLHKYYSNRKRHEEIVRTIALHKNRSDVCVAQALAYKEITLKINLLFMIAKNGFQQFSTENLKDAWYLNATIDGNKKGYFPQQSLLLITTGKHDLQKTKTLLDAGAHCNSGRCHSPVALLAGPNKDFHSYTMLSPATKKIHFAILELLLKAKADPDSRCGITSFTLLQRVVDNNDQERARLLLEYGANPYKLYFDDFYKQYNCYNQLDVNTGKMVKWTHPEFKKFTKTAKKLSLDTLYFETDNSQEPWKQNAFHLNRGEPKGWLKTMYDEIQEAKNKNELVTISYLK